MAGKKILVVDDNAIVQKTLSMKLRNSGYQVISAGDVSTAMTTVRREKPDLIFLDIFFPPDIGGPDWDGFRFLDWLHRTDEAKGIPVIMITGGEAEKYKPQAMQYGAVGFLAKPIYTDVLLAAVRQALGEPGES